MRVQRSRLCSLLACLQVEARAYLEERLRACPEGTAVVTLGRRPLHGSHWLLTRCVLGATPQLIHIEVSPTEMAESVQTYRHLHVADYDK